MVLLQNEVPVSKYSVCIEAVLEEFQCYWGD